MMGEGKQLLRWKQRDRDRRGGEPMAVGDEEQE
jgi:hypothetical protein